MAKITKAELARYESERKTKTHTELQLVVPNDVAATFREVAKAAKISTAALFEEMVMAHAAGLNIKTKSK